MRDYRRLSFAFLCALLAFGATAFVQFHRDAFFIAHWQESPNFRADPDPALEQVALAKLEQLHPGQTCLVDWVGKDENFLYLTGGCATFRREGSGVVEASGDPTYIPYRISYDHTDLGRAEAADLHYLENSLRRLFPKAAADLVRVRMNPELFRQRGWAKASGAK